VNSLPLVSATASQSTKCLRRWEKSKISRKVFFVVVQTLVLFVYELFFKPSGSGAMLRHGRERENPLLTV